MKSVLYVIAMCIITCCVMFSQVIISGKVTGCDGKPMVKADVQLKKLLTRNPIAETTVANDGNYSLTTQDSGVILVTYSGANHKSYDVALYIEKPSKIMLDVQLSSYDYVDTISTVSIIGDFNDFNFATAKLMTKQTDGTFLSEFETKADTFKYQILGIETTGRSINGTQSDGFIRDPGNDYLSFVNANKGRVRIVFDPAKIVRSNAIAQSHILGDDSLDSRFSSIYSEMMKRRDAYRNAARAFEKTGKDRSDFSYDWSKDKAYLTSRITIEKRKILNQLYIISYLDVGGFRARDLDSNIVRLMYSEILPTSPLWSINPFLPQYFSMTGDKEKAEKYIKEMEEKNADINVRAYLVMNRMATAQYSHKTEEYFKLYDRMVTEFKDTDVGKMTKERFSRDLKLKAGTFVPDFSFVSMDDPKIVHTNKTLLGRVYLLDFWSTWCGGCVAEMENLHKAYEKFRSKGFEILSLSFDGKLENVIKFRKNKWKMPWFNSLIEKGFDNDIVKQFDIIGVPSPILVDKTGKIVALNEDLRGVNLEKTLEKVIGK